MIQRLKGIQTEFAAEKMHLPVPKSYALSASSTVSNSEQSLIPRHKCASGKEKC